jgi:MFS family permease
MRRLPGGMTAFGIVWFGQFVSMLGTGMTRFALTIWAYQVTGSATALALVAFFSFAPALLTAPLAGALVDRWNRKLVMALSDLAAGLASVVVLILYGSGHLEIWQLYVTAAFAAAFESFQWPAFSAAMTMIVPKEQYARANGLVSLAEAAAGIVAPILAGILLTFIGLGGILAIDIVTFVFAVLTILLVTIPQPAESATGKEGRGSLWEESIYGFRYIWRRKSLLGVQLTFTVSNFFFSMAIVVVAPMILARTGNDELALGTVQSAMGVGALVGGLVLSAWGGFRRRVFGVLLGFIGGSLLGNVPLGVGQDVVAWSIGAFFLLFFTPIINGSNQALWQAKVAPDVQGRVFAARRFIAQISEPLGILLAGLLADRVFEPAMMPGGAWSATFGGLVGVGPGAGMALLILVVGLLGALAGVVGLVVPVIRRADLLLADHDGTPALALESA